MSPLVVIAVAVAAAVASPTPDAAVEAPQALRLTLDEVLARAKGTAPALELARARAGLSEADVVAARPFLPADPTLELGAGGRVGGGQDGADLSIAVSQAFDVSGAPGLRRTAAAHEVHASALDVEQTALEVQVAVTRAFFLALVEDAAVEVADEAVGDAARLAEIARQRVAAGDASPVQVRLTDTAAARAREQALGAREGQTSARLALARVAGFDGAIAPRGDLQRPAALPPIDGLLDLAAHTPALQALQASLSARDADVDVAAREGLPRPTVGVDYSVEGASPGAAGATSQTQHIATATLALPLPVFVGNDAGQAASAARRRVAAAALLQARQRVAGDVVLCRARAEAARGRLLVFTDEILPGLAETHRLLEEGFRAGTMDIAEVMLAREQLLGARREALDGWRRWFSARADLEGATGAPL